MPTEAEIKKIVDLHKSGLSQGQIAKELDKGKGTINRVLQGLGLTNTNGTTSERSRTKKATEARKEYCAEKRIALIDAGMKKLEEMLPSIDKPNGMRDWFVALGTAIDKRRLEDPPKPAENESDGFMEALDAKAEEIWKDHAEADPVQVDPLQPEAMADSHLVEQSKSCPIT